MTILTRAEAALLHDLQARGPREELFPNMRGAVCQPTAVGPAPGRPAARRADGPEETGETTQRRAFWQAHSALVGPGERATGERVARWVRRLVATDLGRLGLDELQGLGWDARVLIWLRHHRLGYHCPFQRTCRRLGPQGACLAPVSLPLLTEIQRQLRRTPEAPAPAPKKTGLRLLGATKGSGTPSE